MSEHVCRLEEGPGAPACHVNGQCLRAEGKAACLFHCLEKLKCFVQIKINIACHTHTHTHKERMG